MKKENSYEDCKAKCCRYVVDDVKGWTDLRITNQKHKSPLDNF